MSTRTATILHGVVMIGLIVGVDVAFLRDRFWARLVTNVAIVAVSLLVYYVFIV
ncbi:MAG: hypothetical protein U0R68_07475 [Candidatus Nanopelagicales bacterium]